MPRETLECLLKLELPVDYIHGNGDREVLAQMRGIETDWYRGAREQWREPVRWSAQQLAPEHEKLLSAWPAALRMKLDSLGEVFFCHATPRNDTEIFTRLTPAERLLPLLEPLDVPVAVCGRTHMQFDRRIGATRVANAGSVGMPLGIPAPTGLCLGPASTSAVRPTTLRRPRSASARRAIRKRRSLPIATCCDRRPKQLCSKLLPPPN